MAGSDYPAMNRTLKPPEVMKTHWALSQLQLMEETLQVATDHALTEQLCKCVCVWSDA